MAYRSYHRVVEVLLKTHRQKLLTVLKAAILYFALVFGAGFVLGPIRILFIVPRFGVRIAELMEAPIMLLVIVFVSKWMVRRFRLASIALSVGFLALGLMIVLEFTLVLWLRGLTIGEYFQERDPIAGFVYYLLLIVFALMPFFITLRTKVDHDAVHS